MLVPVYILIFYDPILESVVHSDIVYSTSGFNRVTCPLFSSLAGSLSVGTPICLRPFPISFVGSVRVLVGRRCFSQACTKAVRLSVSLAVLVGFFTRLLTLIIFFGLGYMPVCSIGLMFYIGRTGIFGVLVGPSRVFLVTYPGQLLSLVDLSQ